MLVDTLGLTGDTLRPIACTHMDIPPEQEMAVIDGFPQLGDMVIERLNGHQQTLSTAGQRTGGVANKCSHAQIDILALVSDLQDHVATDGEDNRVLSIYNGSLIVEILGITIPLLGTVDAVDVSDTGKDITGFLNLSQLLHDDAGTVTLQQILDAGNLLLDILIGIHDIDRDAETRIDNIQDVKTTGVEVELVIDILIVQDLLTVLVVKLLVDNLDLGTVLDGASDTLVVTNHGLKRSIVHTLGMTDHRQASQQQEQYVEDLSSHEAYSFQQVSFPLAAMPQKTHQHDALEPGKACDADG